MSLFGSSDSKKRSCATTDALAVNGGDLVKIGARGKEIGVLISELLDMVIEEPSLNERDKLLAIAKERLGGL